MENFKVNFNSLLHMEKEFQETNKQKTKEIL